MMACIHHNSVVTFSEKLNTVFFGTHCGWFRALIAHRRSLIQPTSQTGLDSASPQRRRVAPAPPQGTTRE